MAETTLNIQVRVEGAAQSEAQIKGVSTSVQGVGKSTDETSKKTSNLRKTLGGLATGFLVYKGAQWIKGAVEETSELYKGTVALQRVTGMDATTAAGWVKMAKERGISSKALNIGFITLARQTVELSKGSKTATEMFQKLGIPTKAFLQMNAEQRVLAISDAFRRMGPTADRAAAAQHLFGRNAQALLPLLDQGHKALGAQVTEMGKSTGVTKASLKEGLNLVKGQREMEGAMLGVKIAIATALIPILQALTQVITPIAKGFATLMQRSGFLRIAVVVLTAALVVFVATVWLANTGLFVLTATVAIIPALIAAAIVIFVILYEKVGWFHNAVKAVWEWIKGNWPLLLGIISGPIGLAIALIVTHFKQVKQIAEEVFNAIKKVVETVAKVIANVFVGAFNDVKKAVEGVIKVIGGMIHTAEKITSLPGKALHFLGIGQTGLYTSTPGMALVGEHGPEMVHLPGGAQVHPFVQNYGAGGGKIVVHAPVYLDRRQIGLAMGSYVADQQAAR